MWPFSSQGSRQRGVLEPRPAPPSVNEQAPVKLGVDLDDQSLFKITGLANQRLGIHPVIRAPVLGIAAFLCGFSIGAAHGGPLYAYRYRAENAHRLPTTQGGWFLYQKSKNYHTLLGAMKEGAKYGCVLLGWSVLFMAAEEGIDRARGRLLASGDEEMATGQRDAANTVLAAMGVAGFYSWKNRLDQFAAARTARLALRISLPFGLIQDAAACVRGSEPAYVRWVMRHTFWPNRDVDT